MRGLGAAGSSPHEPSVSPGSPASAPGSRGARVAPCLPGHLSHLTDENTESPGSVLAQSHTGSPEAEDWPRPLLLCCLLSQPRGWGATSKSFQEGTAGGGGRPGREAWGAGRQRGALDRAGDRPLEEAVLRLGPGPGAACLQRPLWFWLQLPPGFKLRLWLWLLLGLQGAVTGDGGGGVDFIQGGARGEASEEVSGCPCARPSGVRRAPTPSFRPVPPSRRTPRTPVLPGAS